METVGQNERYPIGREAQGPQDLLAPQPILSNAFSISSFSIKAGSLLDSTTEWCAFAAKRMLSPSTLFPANKVGKQWFNPSGYKLRTHFILYRNVHKADNQKGAFCFRDECNERFLPSSWESTGVETVANGSVHLLHYCRPVVSEERGPCQYRFPKGRARTTIQISPSSTSFNSPDASSLEKEGPGRIGISSATSELCPQYFIK